MVNITTCAKPSTIVAGIAEQNPVLAKGVLVLLAESGMIQGRVVELKDGQPASDRDVAPCNVVIFDPCQIDEDVGAFMARVRKLRKDAAFVAYSTQTSRDQFLAPDSADNLCHVSKSDEPENLVLATLSAHRGAMYFSRSVSSGEGLAPDVLVSRIVPRSDDRLSPRENAVLLSFARGKALKQISEDLGLSERTVITYKSRAAKKLNLSSRSDIVQYALANRLI
ncbi:helix-turn-helix transcriptional regulator [Tropicimonas sediminicola]|uniref:DNA-binding response regulator, NarL/FixJ family, contains REC and HTH domains n=1 Tax=Tropicimonas sediminicola TaxID=1031541 RepID=A0A239LS23_9RHOB|nr:response regulator transcription factor [Tropicimonas sediminicola]SNT32499.1 DNA-binding response regulator, NarL/FixJ family, contains REC and HTH domains [Tropicimonas sediminicola]